MVSCSVLCCAERPAPAVVGDVKHLAVEVHEQLDDEYYGVDRSSQPDAVVEGDVLGLGSEPLEPVVDADGTTPQRERV